MEIRIVTKKYGRSPLNKALCKLELKEFARRVIRGTEQSEGAKLELLFSLPGIFAMELLYRGASVRLIKEGDVFRVMEKSEKSAILLSVRIHDRDALKKLIAGKYSINLCVSQGRVSIAGATEFFCVFTRILNESDRVFLSSGKYREMYLSEKSEKI